MSEIAKAGEDIADAVNKGYESAEKRGYAQAIADNSNQLDRAFSMLEMYGVPKERAKSVSNGIMVLGERIRKRENDIERYIKDNALAIKIYEKIKDRVPPEIGTCHECMFHNGRLIGGECCLFDRIIDKSSDLPDMCRKFFKEAVDENTKAYTAGATEFYDKGDKNGYNKAVEDCISCLQTNHYSVSGLEKLQQLKKGE